MQLNESNCWNSIRKLFKMQNFTLICCTEWRKNNHLKVVAEQGFPSSLTSDAKDKKHFQMEKCFRSKSVNTGGDERQVTVHSVQPLLENSLDTGGQDLPEALETLGGNEDFWNPCLSLCCRKSGEKQLPQCRLCFEELHKQVDCDVISIRVSVS